MSFIAVPTSLAAEPCQKLPNLKVPGLEREILEFSNRVGGRIYTHHFTQERHQYYDAVSVASKAVLYSADSIWGSYHDDIDVTPTPTQSSTKGEPASLPKQLERVDIFKVGSRSGGLVPENNVTKGAAKIMDEIYNPFKLALDDNFREGWQTLIKEDSFSTRQILRRNFASNTLDHGFTDNLMDNYISSVPDVVVDGDAESASKADQVNVRPQLEKREKRVTAISIDRTTDDLDTGMLVQVSGEDNTRRYSTVFNTTTLACAQRMDLRGAGLSFAQNEATRVLKYDTSCKIAMRVKTNWWKKAGIIGGEAATDLPIRLCVYPSYNIDDDPNQPAVLLCSYTWSQDAQRMGSLIGHDGKGKTDELLDLCIRNFAQLHANIITESEIRK
ncbi:L-amino acid oxidase [Cadophora sp. MPI-SDFR-AT-0126]|nr:L-amino acid oxidase [Leotiomycetes sp. MPI-SDFR-AT-0126]